MSNPRYRVRVTKDHLVFSAAHFITFNGNVCERLHGHNWRTAVELAGPLDENRYVFDFIALRDALQTIVDELDHRMLLPTAHPSIQVNENDGEVEVRFAERRWLFPREDCVLLPVANTTAEEIAHWIAGRLRDEINATKEIDTAKEINTAKSREIESICVEVEENFGQSAFCELRLA